MEQILNKNELHKRNETNDTITNMKWNFLEFNIYIYIYIYLISKIYYLFFNKYLKRYLLKIFLRDIFSSLL
ncbi:MAG: hypothetical protein N7Q72_04940, partial [Spiroplasma sp. Tabriz.8]|nr:hypothetical protein [Spiroplasma sp. Tabriz.8]